MTTPLRIGLNLVYLLPGETGGMETYARQVIPRLAALEHLRLTVFVNRETAEQQGQSSFDGVPMVTVPVRSSNRLQWVRGEQQLLPRLAGRAGCQILHSLGNTGPVWGAVPRVTTIHDVKFKLTPESQVGWRRLGLLALVPAAARRSRRVITDSEASRRDIVDHFRVPPERIDVIPLAASVPSGLTADGARARLALELGDRQIVLCPSAKLRHKNLSRLLDAVAAIPAARRPALVIPGYTSDYEQELERHAASLGLGRDEVRFLGWLPASDLEDLYAAADMVAYPSLHEGFGLPILEAMIRGVPVACANRSSLPEVAGDAAVLFDPESVDAIRRAIERLLENPAEAERFAVRGREQAARFSWERTARLTADVYTRVLR